MSLAPACPVPPAPSDSALRVETLPPGQGLRLLDASGRPLLEIVASEAGPVLRLLTSSLCLQRSGVLRIAADRLELAGGRGGVHLDSQGDLRLHGRCDTVVTSRIIALNPPEGQAFSPRLRLPGED